MSFFLLDVVKPLSLNEEKSHEKELGHITIQLFESDVKRGGEIGISEVEKGRSSFLGFMKTTAEKPHTFKEKLLSKLSLKIGGLYWKPVCNVCQVRAA